LSIGRRPAAITVARVHAIEIAFHWRWAPILVLGTVLLARNVLPVRFPAWEPLTIWLVSSAAVLAGEAALLLHELSHALVARASGHEVQRIVFHGFLAETIVGEYAPTPDQEALIALVGPATNLALALFTQAVRFAFTTSGPLDVVLQLLVISNVAMTLMSLVPLGGSDGNRALRALKRARVAPVTLVTPFKSSDCPSARG
jgi:Zn-dependent protease